MRHFGCQITYDSEIRILTPYGYFKTKLFMAKRISEQQIEIENLKESLLNMTTNYTNLFDLLKSKI